MTSIITINIFIILMTPVIIILHILIIHRKRTTSKRVLHDETTQKNSLGELLKTYRGTSNMSQEYVAQHLSVSRQAVSQWESDLATPSTSNLITLAKLYNIPLETLIHQIKE